MKDLTARVLSIIELDRVDLIAREVVVQLPSSKEFYDMRVPLRAKSLRWTLVRRIQKSTTVEEAREHIFALAEALDE